jgi:carboxynorspermidine decarboxylase
MLNGLDIRDCPSPCYIVDLELLRRNAERLDMVRQQSGASVLLALKGFAMHSTFPVLRDKLDGICASGLYEAQLGHDTFGKQVHTYSPAFKDDEIDQILQLSNHITFNSLHQWERFRLKALTAQVACGLRINPECSVADVPLYDPCAPGSRLGIRAAQLKGADLTGLTGLHVHALCEQDTTALKTVVEAVESRFGDYLHQAEWLNLGGGHHVTRADYNIEELCSILSGLAQRYKLKIFIEPGEAVALNTGILVATVEDIIDNNGNIAVLDVSATCHMPDVLEMPYRPGIVGAGAPNEKPYTYRLAGNSCLAGDQIGSYSFDAPLTVGSRLAFLDMAHYTIVKTTMFNGVRHPALATWEPDSGTLNIIRRFTYDDYRNRLS